MNSINPKIAGASSFSLICKSRTFAAWLMWTVTASFVLFQFFLQLTSGEIVDGLMKSFSLSAFGGGLLASTYYYIYVVLQTPAGLLIDRYGPRRLLSLGALVCGLGSLMFGVSHSLVLAVTGRLLMGTGAAFAFVGVLNVIAQWFPLNRFAFMTAISETIGMIGSIFGGLFLAQLVQNLGWRSAMVGASVLAILIGLLIFWVVRDAPQNQDPLVSLPKPTKESLLRDLKKLVSNPIAWVNGMYSGLMFSIVTVFVALWAIPYFQLAHHISLIVATLTGDLLFVGVAIGGPIIGWLDGRIAQRRPLMMSCSLISAVLLSLLIFLPQLSIAWVMVLMIFLGLFLSAYIITFPVANEIVPHTMRGSSMGFVNMLSVGTAPLLQPLVGLILHLVANPATQVGIDRYTVHDYQIALSIMPLVLLVSAYLTKWIPNRSSFTI